MTTTTIDARIAAIMVAFRHNNSIIQSRHVQNLGDIFTKKFALLELVREEKQQQVGCGCFYVLRKKMNTRTNERWVASASLFFGSLFFWVIAVIGKFMTIYIYFDWCKRLTDVVEHYFFHCPYCPKESPQACSLLLQYLNYHHHWVEQTCPVSFRLGSGSGYTYIPVSFPFEAVMIIGGRDECHQRAGKLRRSGIGHWLIRLLNDSFLSTAGVANLLASNRWYVSMV